MSGIDNWRPCLPVLADHPLSFAAHSNWMPCQDAQIDYRRNLLATFPNLHIDLRGTFQYFHLADLNNLRSFMIEWMDRIPFGTELGRWKHQSENQDRTQKYVRAFQILEANGKIPGSFF